MTYAAFLLYPIVAWALFRGLSFVVAIPSSLLVGYLFLPAAFDIAVPLLPDLSKDTWPAIVTLALAAAFGRGPGPADPARAAGLDTGATPLEGWLPAAAWSRILLAMAILGPVMTTAFNREALVFGDRVLPGLAPFDAANMVQSAAVTMLAIVIGRRYLAGADGQRALLLALAVAGLAYSLPTLAEVRLSPQLHSIVYGYFPHSWVQHLRGGGFRPVVFMEHGLVLSLFLCMSALAIIGYMRAIDGDRRVLYFLAALYMTVVLLLSRSLGMVLVAVMLVPLLLVATVRLQLIAAALIAAVVLAYPAGRAVGFSPLAAVADVVAQYDANRASSLRFRLDSEDAVLDRIAQKPLFGWGGWGRGEAWTDDGQRMSTRDGHWLIALGQFGIVGFVGIYGLLAIPIILLAARQRSYGLTAETSALCVILAANMLDLIPNSGLSALSWLIAGSLIGRVELGAATQAAGATPQIVGSDPAGDGSTPDRKPGHVYATKADSSASGPAILRFRYGKKKGAAAADRAAPQGTEATAKVAPEAAGQAKRSYSRFGNRHNRTSRRTT